MSSGNFAKRHIGPRDSQQLEMLQAMGYATMEELLEATLPAGIRSTGSLDLPTRLRETAYLEHLEGVSKENTLFRRSQPRSVACIRPGRLNLTHRCSP